MHLLVSLHTSTTALPCHAKPPSLPTRPEQACAPHRACPKIRTKLGRTNILFSLLHFLFSQVFVSSFPQPVLIPRVLVPAVLVPWFSSGTSGNCSSPARLNPRRHPLTPLPFSVHGYSQAMYMNSRFCFCFLLFDHCV